MEAAPFGRLIVVDDEPELMNVLCKTLSIQGYDTTGFTSGKEALDALRHRDFDVLLTDLMMPEMDGISLLRTALEIDPLLVGVVMTGQGTVQTAVEAMKAGALDYILKPFKVNAILPVIEKAIEVKRLREENIQLKETVAMYELGKTIFFTLDFNTVLNKVADAALAQCRADEVSILLPVYDEEEFYVALSRGRKDGLILGERIPLKQGPLGWVVARQEPLILSGVIDDEAIRPVCPRKEIVSAVSIPLLAGGAMIGVLNVNATHARRPFTSGEVKALSILTSIAAPTIYGIRLMREVTQAEKKYRSIFENAVEGIFQTTPEGRFLAANGAMARMLHYASPEDLMQSVTNMGTQIYVNPADRQRLREILDTQGIAESFEAQLLRKDGGRIWASINGRAVKDGDGNIVCYEGTVEDITAHKTAQEAVRESEERYRIAIEHSNDGVAIVKNGVHVYVNNKMLEIFGYEKPEEILQGEPYLVVHPDDRAKVISLNQRRHEGEPVPDRYEFKGVRKDGHTVHIEVSVATITYSGERATLAYLRDITERKMAEDALKRSEEKYRTLFDTSPDAVILADAEMRIITANHQAEALGLFSSLEDIEGQNIFDCMFAKGRSGGAEAKATRELRENRYIECLEVEMVRKDGTVFPAELSGSVVMDEEGRPQYIIAVARDITERKGWEKALRESHELLKRTIEETVVALTSALEKRDPYTVGHQKRVADISCAIAKEMGLSNDAIEGIRITGILHDIGKIYIPTEILSKPGIISAPEFALVKTHPEAGYEIVKGIEFPWPVAEVIYEHHERIDGSGYPKGLKGEDILLEAKIISVADVLEAISSHRPYRPSLGVQAALEEVERNKGTLYDPDVVEICVKLYSGKDSF